MAYAHVTRRSDLRDLARCLNAEGTKLYCVGNCGAVPRSTLADVVECRDYRDYRLFEELGQRLIATVVAVYGDQDIGRGFKGSILVRIDLRGAILVYLSIATGAAHDTDLFDGTVWSPGSILAVDRSDLDFPRLLALHR